MTKSECKRGRNQLFESVCAFILLILVMTISAVGQSPSARRPANVPPEFAVTPFGYMHPSCVKHLSKGESGGENKLVHADGTVEDVPVCQYPRYKLNGELAESAATTEPYIDHSWVSAITDFYSTNLGEEYSTFVVPPAPTTQEGQVVFFFPGIGNIMQPVLQWNNNIGNVWTIASWICCSPAMESTPVQVSPGDLISGTITQNCSRGTSSCSSWNVSMTDMTNGQSTTLGAAAPTQGDQWEAVGGALEVAGLNQCSDYPPGGEFVFNSTFYDYNGNWVPNLSWSGGVTASLSPECNYSVQATTESDLVFTYGNVPNLNGAHTLAPQNATGSRLDDLYGGTGAGNTIDIYPDFEANNPSQIWVFSNANVVPAGYYNLAVSYGPYCMTASGSASGSLVQLDPCNGSPAQAWQAVTAGNGYVFHPANNTSLCLDVQGDGTAPETSVIAWTCNGGNNEQWVLN